MTGQPAYNATYGQLVRCVSEAIRELEATRDDRTALHLAGWLVETLREATITTGQVRGATAARIKETERLSLAQLGDILGVSKTRAETLMDKVKQAKQPVVAAIVTSPEGVLIGKRNDGMPPWTFIAGEIEPRESTGDAAVREVKEETGCLVRAGRIIARRVHPATGRTMIYMAAQPTHGTDIVVGDEAELSEVRWASLSEIDELLPGVFEPVRAYLVDELGA
jgi:8-oxo-dGTP pyrophosphatase MutT (NUDIX family)